MKQILLMAFVLATVMPTSASAQGDPKVGETAFRGRLCYFCHGENGEGGFGPDLAGRGLTVDQYKRAIRQPWGVMPTYVETQLSDDQIAGIKAFMNAKPQPKEPGHSHWPAASASAPYEQRVYMQVTGCGQCHEPENKYARAIL